MDAAAARAYRAGQRLAIDRFDLLALELERRAARTAKASTVALAAGVCMAIAWCALVAAAVLAAEPRWPLPGVLLTVAGGHLALAGGLACCAARSLRGEGA